LFDDRILASIPQIGGHLEDSLTWLRQYTANQPIYIHNRYCSYSLYCFRTRESNVLFCYNSFVASQWMRADVGIPQVEALMTPLPRFQRPFRMCSVTGHLGYRFKAAQLLKSLQEGVSPTCGPLVIGRPRRGGGIVDEQYINNELKAVMPLPNNLNPMPYIAEDNKGTGLPTDVKSWSEMSYESIISIGLCYDVSFFRSANLDDARTNVLLFLIGDLLPKQPPMTVPLQPPPPAGPLPLGGIQQWYTSASASAIRCCTTNAIAITRCTSDITITISKYATIATGTSSRYNTTTTRFTQHRCP
jgi:hypothetical protein